MSPIQVHEPGFNPAPRGSSLASPPPNPSPCSYRHRPQTISPGSTDLLGKVCTQVLSQPLVAFWGSHQSCTHMASTQGRARGAGRDASNQSWHLLLTPPNTEKLISKKKTPNICIRRAESSPSFPPSPFCRLLIGAFQLQSSKDIFRPRRTHAVTPLAAVGLCQPTPTPSHSWQPNNGLKPNHNKQRAQGGGEKEPRGTPTSPLGANSPTPRHAGWIWGTGRGALH